MHEIGYQECSRSYVFRGNKDYNQKQIQDMLGLSAQNRAAPRPGQPLPPQTFGAARFLMPVQQCEFQLTGILEALSRDPWPVANDKRSLRCTGVALSVAVGLLEVSSNDTYRVVLLTERLCSDDIPEHRCPYHALRWRASDRGTWYGSKQ